jgi:hypothetical protein
MFTYPGGFDPSAFPEPFSGTYRSHLKHLKLKGLQPKTIDAYARTGHEGAGLGQDDATPEQAREISPRRSATGLSQQLVGSGLCRVIEGEIPRQHLQTPTVLACVTKLQDIVRLGR